jgi:uncharacterized protein (TIGR00251 family)
MFLLGLKIKSAAKENKVGGFVTIDDKSYLKLSIKSAPEKGKANLEIIKFLASKLDLKQQDLEILTGHNTSLKVISIKNTNQEEAMGKLK